MICFCHRKNFREFVEVLDLRFKPEWYANHAIQKLNGRLIGGRRIEVQKARYMNRSATKPVHNTSTIVQGNLNRSLVHRTKVMFRHGLRKKEI